MYKTGIELVAMSLAKRWFLLPVGTQLNIVEEIGQQELAFQWCLYGEEYGTPENMIDTIEKKAFDILDIMDKVDRVLTKREEYMT